MPQFEPPQKDPLPIAKDASASGPSRVGELADADLGGLHVRQTAARPLEPQREIVKILLAVAVGPPEPRISDRKRRMVDLSIDNGPRFAAASVSRTAGRSMSPIFPRSSPLCGRREWLLNVGLDRQVGRRSAGASGRSVMTTGSAMVTSPLALRNTRSQIPMFRSRIVGIQSQAADSTKVGALPGKAVGQGTSGRAA